MKSAFAKADTHTYTYPEPLDPKNTEPLSAFFKGHIDKDVEKAVKGGEVAPWVRLKIPRAKGLRDAIADAVAPVRQLATNGGDTTSMQFVQHVAIGNKAVFEILVEEWSLPGGDGIAASAENFAKLDPWASAWVEACLVNAQIRAEPDFQEAATSSSSKRGSGRGGRAPANASA